MDGINNAFAAFDEKPKAGKKSSKSKKKKKRSVSEMASVPPSTSLLSSSVVSSSSSSPSSAPAMCPEEALSSCKKPRIEDASSPSLSLSSSSSSSSLSSSLTANASPRTAVLLEPTVADREEELERWKEKRRLDNASRVRFGEYARQEMTKSSIEAGSKSCVTERCFPPGYDAESEVEKSKQRKIPSEPAKKYPFTLDLFQQKSVDCLELGESVLVAAHTSAGKTVVAEYAIAMALRDNQRVVYTSPIKALSNQKYRELYEEFEDVGLMTGDITINPSASCLVMTTEILRSMLYRGSQVIREVAWVIFDEVHYMRDKERGVVWEETLILLPEKVRYVFLSATIPNASEFALWIAKLHNHVCNVVYTEFRPTPLQHYLFPSGGDGLYLVVDENGTFREANFQKTLAVLNEKGGDAVASAKTTKKKGKKRQFGQKTTQASDMYKIVRMIMDRHYDPVIIFAFSKRECEENALSLSKLDFTDDDEKQLINQIFSNALESLSDDDKKLPQVQNILPLLRRGIGIHHGGLLPLLKEVIEILFQEGLLKALFATETFAMGLNMPAKTVVFTNVQKFDGEKLRALSAGEYIQMSGRAGRRGLDDRGVVIMMTDTKLEPDVTKNMIKGQADPLFSSFYLSYNMLLNLLRVEEADPEFMMARSFRQFQNTRAAPKYEAEIAEFEAKKANITLKDEDAIASYRTLREQLESVSTSMRETINTPLHILPFLNPGRLVRIKDATTEWGWGIIVNFQKKKKNKKKSRSKTISVDMNESNEVFIVDVLLAIDSESIPANPTSSKKAQQNSDRHKFDSLDGLRPAPVGNKKRTSIHVVPVTLNLFNGISSLRVFVPKDIRPKETRKTIGKSLRECVRRFPNGIPLLDPVEDMKIKDETFREYVKKIETLESRLAAHQLHNDPALEEEYAKYEQVLQIDHDITDLKKKMKSAAEDLVIHAKLKSMKRVLRRLGHTTSNNVIDVKGRVACEISTCDELVVTELMFTGVFNELSAQEIVALVSCLVFTEKTQDSSSSRLPANLKAAYAKLTEAAKRVGEVSVDAKLGIDVDEYAQQFKSDMMEIVLAWCNGAKFADICKMTTIFEGTVIRCMRRLEELLRQMVQAAKSIGNVEMETKFTDGINSLKRDIVFAASLYL